MARAKKIFLLLVAILAAIGFLFLQTLNNKISDYTQNKTSISIKFDGLFYSGKYIKLSNVPSVIDPLELKKHATVAVRIGKSITIPLENEPSTGEYSIIVFLGDDYVELVRQSEDWLEDTFGFKRIGGYTILGRRTISTDDRESITWTGPITLIGRPKDIHLQPVDISDYKEVNLATGLLRSLWGGPIEQGPTTLPYEEFLQQSFEEKMRRVQNGEFAVMCTGFRDLFFHASVAIPNLKVRMVEAVNYAPQINDLITYGHSTTEIWIEKLNKWVLFDPWLGIIVTDNGTLVGAEELSKINNAEKISIIPVIDSIPRMYRQKSGKVVFNTFFPKDVKAAQFSCEKLGCAPGYIEYFKNYKVREAFLDAR